MSPSTCSDGACRPVPEDVNAAIRELMNEPASPDRTDRYRLLLARWADVACVDVTCADVGPAA